MMSFYDVTPLGAATLIMSASGSVYLVASYSSKLGTLLDFDTSEVSGFSTMVSAGAWLFIVPGMFVDRFGPKSTALIGVSMIATGYIALALAANQTISINYGAALFLGFLLGHGSAWTQAAALVTSASNTSSARRGAVLGLLQANYSLSSGYYTQINDVFGLTVPGLLLACGIAMSASVLVAWPAHHRLAEGRHSDLRLFVPLVGLTAGSALLIVVATFTGWPAVHAAVVALFGGLALGVSALSAVVLKAYGCAALSMRPTFDPVPADRFPPPFFIAWLECAESGVGPGGGTASGGAAGAAGGEASPLLAGSDADATRCKARSLEADTSEGRPDAALAAVEVTAAASDSMTLRQALATPHFWLLFVAFAIGVGSGLTALDNVSLVVDSHSAHGADDDVHASLKLNCVALFSACNTLGRIGYGALSDWLAGWGGAEAAAGPRGGPLLGTQRVGAGGIRAALLAVNALLMGGAMAGLALTSLGGLYLWVALAAWSYGGFWSLVPALTADLFGPSSYGANVGFIQLAPTLGSELLYNVMSTALFDAHADDGGGCFHNGACFKETFLILAGLSIVSAAAAALAALMVSAPLPGGSIVQAPKRTSTKYIFKS